MAVSRLRQIIQLIVLAVALVAFPYAADQLPRLDLSPALFYFVAPMIVAVPLGLRRSYLRVTDSSLRGRELMLGFIALLLLPALGLYQFGDLSDLDVAVMVASLIVMLAFIVSAPLAFLTGLILLGSGAVAAGYASLVEDTDGPSLVILTMAMIVVFAILTLSVNAARYERHRIAARLADTPEGEGFESFRDLIDGEDEVVEMPERRPALQALDEILADRTFGDLWRRRLAQANLDITVAEFAALHIVSMVGFFYLAYIILFPDEILAPIGLALVGLFVPRLYVGYRSASRTIRFYTQLDDSVTYLSNAVGRGYTVAQAMESLARDAPEPTSEEFTRVVMEMQLGVETDDTLTHLTDRISLPDLDLAMMALRIQSRRGGNIARLLGLARDLIAARTRLFFQAGVLKRWRTRATFLIFCAVMFVQWVILPDYFADIWDSDTGRWVGALTYTLLAVAVLVVGYARRGMRTMQRRLGIAAIADLEVFLELVGGLVVLVLLAAAGVPPLPVVVGLLVLVQAEDGLSGLGLAATVAILFLLGPLLLILAADLLTYLLDVLPTIETTTATAMNTVAPVVDAAAAITVTPPPTPTPIAPVPTPLPPGSEIGTTARGTDLVATLLLTMAVSSVLIIAMMIYLGFRKANQRDALQERLAEYADQELPDSLEEVVLSMSFQDRVLLPLIDFLGRPLARIMPQWQIALAEAQLDRAGSDTPPFVWFILRALTTLSGAGLGLMIVSAAPVVNAAAFAIVVGGLALLGFVAPPVLLNLEINRRRRQVGEELPEVLTLLNMYLSVGYGLDVAMASVYEELDGLVPLAFGRVTFEMQLGKLRREALRDMALRLDQPDLNAVVSDLIISEQLGAQDIADRVQRSTETLREAWATRLNARTNHYAQMIDLVWQSLLIFALVLWLVSPLIVGFLT